MMELHPEILKKNGKSEFVVLPYEEFVAIQELLMDVEDILELRQAKQDEADEANVSLADVRERFGLDG